MKGPYIAFGVLVACTAFAIPSQTEIVTIQPNSPVQLTPGQCASAPDRGTASMPEVSCDISLTNLGQHRIVAYTIVWTPAQRGPTFSSKFALEPKPSLLVPGQTITHHTYIAKTDDAAVKVSVDFVLYDDGTYWGDEKSQVLKTLQTQITLQRTTREAVRAKLLAAAGDDTTREFVKRTLDGDLADHTRDKYLTARRVGSENR